MRSYRANGTTGDSSAGAEQQHIGYVILGTSGDSSAGAEQQHIGYAVLKPIFS